MADVAALLEAVERLADRFRALPQSRLLGAVPGRGSRAEAGWELARALAEAAQRVEAPGRAPHPFPEAGPYAVGDQIAVAGHDLVAALTEAGGAGAGGDGGAAGEDAAGVAARVLEEALREVAATERLAFG